MKEFLIESSFLAIFISLLTFEISSYLKSKTKNVLCNPLLISMLLIIVFLKIFNIPYVKYKEGTKYITYLLTPATICLALPLYEKMKILKDNFIAIIIGISVGVITSALVIFIFSYLFKLNHKEYITLLPKSITTAIGIDLSREYGGYEDITVTLIVITGVIGNIFAELILKIFRVKNKVAKGIGIGCASHAMGTSKAMEMGEVEGAMSSLSIVLTGILTVLFINIFVNLI